MPETLNKSNVALGEKKFDSARFMSIVASLDGFSATAAAIKAYRDKVHPSRLRIFDRLDLERKNSLAWVDSLSQEDRDFLSTYTGPESHDIRNILHRYGLFIEET